MFITLPFHLSPAAEEYIRASLASGLPPTLEPGLARVFGHEAASPAGQTETFSGEHFIIAHETPELWASARLAVRALVTDRPFWIPQDVIKVLHGKTLTVKASEAAKRADVPGDLLVAV